MVAGGLGGLNIPKKVHFPGDDTFKGRIIHTAEWDTSFNTENRRVAVIGTGPSAVQTVPSIAPKVTQFFALSPLITRPLFSS